MTETEKDDDDDDDGLGTNDNLRFALPLLFSYKLAFVRSKLKELLRLMMVT